MRLERLGSNGPRRSSVRAWSDRENIPCIALSAWGMPAFSLLRSARDVSSIQLYTAERDHTLILSGTLRKTTADALLDPTLCYPMV